MGSSRKSRRRTVPVEGRDGTLERLREVGDSISRDLGNAGFDPVDLEVGGPESICELLTAQLLRDPDLLDPTGNEVKGISHVSRLSDSDSRRNHLSTPGGQPRDSVDEVVTRPHELSWEQIERWLRDLGFVKGSHLDWARFSDEAGIGTEKAMLKKRWNEGGVSQKLKAKVRSELERIEREQGTVTTTGEVTAFLDQWASIGRDLALDPVALHAAIEGLRSVAANVKQMHEARLALQQLEQERSELELSGVLASAFNEPTKKRK